jgi:UDP-GlcNAc:undecaprenyl-phosphate/decaprenyl-phosphate GlcNAc-1-phosphate transferase
MQLFTVFILSLFLTIALVPVIRRVAFRMHIMDEPDARKVHVVAMPKTGGISMALGMLVPMMLWVPRDVFVSSVLAGAFIIFVFGLTDDIRPLKAWQKLLPQTAAALIVIIFGGVRITCLGDLLPQQCPLPDYLVLPLTLLTILGVINAINLSDGLDGLAGGISMLSFMLIGILAFYCGNMTVGVMCAAVIGAIIGFLRYNSHPAVLFMGDAGSQLLGFFLGVFAIAVTQSETPYSKILALLIVGFPILDTLTVMAVRIKHRRSPFSPDKNHFHHRLLGMGFFHTEAVLSIYLIQSFFVVFALVTRFHSEWLHLGGFVGLSAVILGFFLAASKTGWNLHRDSRFDLLVKQRLRFLKEQKIFIRAAFGGVKYLLFLLLAVQVMIPEKMPVYFSLAALTLVLLSGVGYFWRLDRFKSNVLRFSVYMVVPLLVYLSEIEPGSWVRFPWAEVIYLGYIALVFFVVMTLNLTRRRHGFKISPLDILVFVIVLVFSNLPAFYVQEFRIGMMLTKGLILYYSFDVLIGELRGSTGILFKPVAAVLALMAVRGFL